GTHFLPSSFYQPSVCWGQRPHLPSVKKSWTENANNIYMRRFFRKLNEDRRSKPLKPLETRKLKFLLLFSLLGLNVLTVLFVSGMLIIQGIPSSIIVKFLKDSEARHAYFQGDAAKVHARLSALNVEKDIKDYYRSKISDPIELDRYIHQLMYDRTGYVGEDYQVTTRGELVLKDGLKTPNLNFK
ncbi:MAG TPA: hypothetical protein V6C46_00870, partial [Coleofasciculaceae cyanobacterium]